MQANPITWANGRPVHTYGTCAECGFPTVDGECSRVRCESNAQDMRTHGNIEDVHASLGPLEHSN
jgi:hypothetical protein